MALKYTVESLLIMCSTGLPSIRWVKITAAGGGRVALDQRDIEQWEVQMEHLTFMMLFRVLPAISDSSKLKYVRVVGHHDEVALEKGPRGWVQS